MNIKNYSVEFVLVGCIIFIIFSYFLSLNLDGFCICKKEVSKGSVEVILEKVPEASIDPIPKKPDKVKLVKTNKKIYLSKKEFDCLSMNVFYEAGVESYIGKVSVANVTYNRLVAKKWGDSFCKVVYKKNQFSWTNKIVDIPSGPLWRESKDAVIAFSKGVRVTKLEKSDHYHANYINPPKWTNNMKIKAKIGKHIFYAEK